MTQSKTGAFPTGRIPQMIGKAALAAALVSGGASLLGAGDAQANCAGIPVGNYVCEKLAGPTFGTAFSSLANPVGGDPQVGTVDTNFVPELDVPGTGYVWYKVTKLNGPITQARIDSDFDLPPGSVQKEIFENITGIAPDYTGINKIWDYTSVDGVPSPIPPAIFTPLTNQTLSVIYVKDTYTVKPGGQLDNFTNTFVPGPLPILGAGAAFGFSRKLRSRIKAARLS